MKKVSILGMSMIFIISLLFATGCGGNNLTLNDNKPPNVAIVAPGGTSHNNHSIEGYTNRISFFPKETIELKVHSPRPTFSIDFIRFGQKEETLLKVRDIPGKPQNYSKDAYKEGANWETSYNLRIPSDWRSGMYSAKLFDNTGKNFYITFIVKEKLTEKAAPIAVVASTNTWQAYNDWGGASFYRYNIKDGTEQKMSNFINIQRPNPAATPIGAVGHLANAERHILVWMEKQGYSYSMLTDWDLHQNPELLKRYKVLVINTHSEYWSKSMYDGLENFLEKGGNLLNLSGNSMYWKVIIQGDKIEVRKDKTNHSLSNELGGTWESLGRPESVLLGDGYNPKGYDTYKPYKVIHSDHWIFSGTGLKNGDLIGVKGLNRGGASGWETDKVDSHSPHNLVLLAQGTNEDGGGADMTYYDNPGGGGVFSVGSITFGGSLAVDDKLSRMVNNVLQRFLSKH